MDVWCRYRSFSTRNGWFVVELKGRGTCMCCLCCSLWLIIVTDYKDTYTVIICIPMFWNNYQFHILGSSSPRNAGIYQSILRYMPEEWGSHLQFSRIMISLFLLSFCSPGIYIATRKSKGLFSQGCREGWILKIAHFLENYNNTWWAMSYLR